MAGAALLLVVAGCGPRYDRAAMLQGMLTSTILPTHEALIREAEALDAAAVAFTTRPTVEGLEEVRARWRATDLAFRAVRPFQFTGFLVLHNALEKRPARQDFIEETVAARRRGERGPIDAAFIAQSGATSKGFGAIEYLLFPAGADPAAASAGFEDPARGEYLAALTAQLVNDARALRDRWTDPADGYAITFVANDSDGADVQGSISLVSNRLIEIFELATRDGLGRPIGRTTDGTPRAGDAEAPISGISLDLLIADVEAVERTFASGLDDYLRHLEGRSADPLADRIVRGLDEVLAALRAIEPPLEEAIFADPEGTGAAYDRMREAIVLLKTEMAAALGITVTFSDSDGD